MTKNIVIAVVIAALLGGVAGGITAGLVGSNQPGQLGAGTRFPNGISSGSSTPPANSNTINVGDHNSTTTWNGGKMCWNIQRADGGSEWLYLTNVPGSPHYPFATSSKPCNI